jgi:hypothetical protein
MVALAWDQVGEACSPYFAVPNPEGPEAPCAASNPAVVQGVPGVDETESIRDGVGIAAETAEMK